MGKAKEQVASMINAGKKLVQNEAGKVMAHVLYVYTLYVYPQKERHFLGYN